MAIFHMETCQRLLDTYKCTQKVHENWKTPAFYAIIEVDKSGIGCGKNEL